MAKAKKTSKKRAKPPTSRGKSTTAKKATKKAMPKKTAPKPKKAPPKAKAPSSKSSSKAAPAKKKPAATKSAKPKAAAKSAAKASKPAKKATASSKGSAPKAAADAPKPAPLPMNSKRKLGLRGAAPWAARHAAKHAAEARARAAEPAPPGSARATIRVPTGAEQIKAKIAELHQQTSKVRSLRKRLEKGFWDIGQVLLEIQHGELYLAKGYGSFEAFLEREIDLGKMTSLKLIKLTGIFQREAALDYGMERCFVALSALEGDYIPKAAPSAPGSKPPPLPLKPPTRLVG